MIINTRRTHADLPVGFSRRRNKNDSSPYPDTARVELMIRTDEGINSSGMTQPRLHDWSIPPQQVGGIVGYRLIDLTVPVVPALPEMIDVSPRLPRLEGREDDGA
jgi:hypothetical protein